MAQTKAWHQLPLIPHVLEHVRWNISVDLTREFPHSVHVGWDIQDFLSDEMLALGSITLAATNANFWEQLGSTQRTIHEAALRHVQTF